MNDAPIDHALAYAEQRNWLVFPAPADGSKKGCTSAERSNGRPWGATKNPELLKRYFRRWPNANIGIPCGPDSGIFVLEADTLKGHNVDGIAALRKLEAEHGSLPITLMAESPTGSLHYYFNYPPGVFIKSVDSKIANGVDVKGDGGMVMAPPSIRPGVGQYRWLNANAVADAPEWLLALIASEAVAQSPNNYEPGEDVPNWFLGAAAALKNNDLSWDAWNERGMSIWIADNSEQGFAAFDAFSRLSTKKYDAKATRERWQHYFKSPPTKMTAGKLHYSADQDNPGWRGRYEEANMSEIARTTYASVVAFCANRSWARKATEQPTAKQHKANASWRDHVYTAAALQRMVFPPVAFCVPDLIPEGLTIIAGKPKIGKSWLALDVCIAITAMVVCLGGREPAQGDVLYAAMEDNPRRMKRRIEKLLAAFDIEWPQKLTLANAWRRLDKGGVNDIREWIEQADNPRLVVLDTLAGVKPVRTQQGYTEDYESLTELHRLANDKGVSIVVLHHTRKMEADDPVDTVSGTLGLAGCADSVLVLNRTSQGTTLYVRGRDIEEAEYALVFDKDTCQWHILGEAREVQRSDARRKILSVLQQATEPLTPQDIASSTGMQPGNVRKLLFHMTHDGEVAKTGRSMYCHPDRGDLLGTPAPPVTTVTR